MSYKLNFILIDLLSSILFVHVERYLWFFLEPIMGLKAENYSFLKKLLENIKQTKDNQEPDNNVVNEVLQDLYLYT